MTSPTGADPHGSPFVAPPVGSETPSQKQSPFEKISQLFKKSGGGEQTQAMPVRTWILLAVTVLVTVGWLLWDDSPEPEPEAPPPVAQPSPATADPSAESPTAADPTAADPTSATADPAIPTPTGTDPTQPNVAPQPSPGVEAGSVPEEQADGPTLQRRAADAFIGGRHGEALDRYRQLAARYPDDPAYGSMIRILQQRLTQCVDGVGPGGAPCN